MNRTASCIEMLKLLKSRGLIKKAELANLLETNIRNISEFKKELELAGYDIEVINGKYGGYRLITSTTLPTIGFLHHEMKALDESTKYLYTHKDFLFYEDYQTAIDKLKMTMYQTSASSSYQYIHQDRNDQHEKIKTYIQICEYAKDHNLAVYITYQGMKDQEASRFLIHPYEILYYQEAYYCMAYSLKAKAFRNFKFSEERMVYAEISKQRFNRDSSFLLDQHIGSLGLVKDEVYTVVVHVQKEKALLLLEKPIGIKQEAHWINENILYMEILLEGRRSVIDFILRLGKYGKLIEPQELKQDLLEELESMLSGYK